MTKLCFAMTDSAHAHTFAAMSTDIFDEYSKLTWHQVLIIADIETTDNAIHTTNAQRKYSVLRHARRA